MKARHKKTKCHYKAEIADIRDIHGNHVVVRSGFECAIEGYFHWSIPRDIYQIGFGMDVKGLIFDLIIAQNDYIRGDRLLA